MFREQCGRAPRNHFVDFALSKKAHHAVGLFLSAM
jgi:hypothetical protein